MKITINTLASMPDTKPSAFVANKLNQALGLPRLDAMPFDFVTAKNKGQKISLQTSVKMDSKIAAEIRAKLISLTESNLLRFREDVSTAKGVATSVFKITSIDYEALLNNPNCFKIFEIIESDNNNDSNINNNNNNQHKHTFFSNSPTIKEDIFKRDSLLSIFDLRSDEKFQELIEKINQLCELSSENGFRYNDKSIITTVLPDERHDLRAIFQDDSRELEAAKKQLNTMVVVGEIKLRHKPLPESNSIVLIIKRINPYALSLGLETINKKVDKTDEKIRIEKVETTLKLFQTYNIHPIFKQFISYDGKAKRSQHHPYTHLRTPTAVNIDADFDAIIRYLHVQKALDWCPKPDTSPIPLETDVGYTEQRLYAFRQQIIIKTVDPDWLKIQFMALQEYRESLTKALEKLKGLYAPQNGVQMLQLVNTSISSTQEMRLNPELLEDLDYLAEQGVIELSYHSRKKISWSDKTRSELEKEGLIPGAEACRFTINIKDFKKFNDLIDVFAEVNQVSRMSFS